MHNSLSKAFIVRGVLVWAYLQERNALDEGLEQKISVVSRLMVNASAKGLTDFDFVYLGVLMDEMLKDDDFIGMSLKDETGFEAMERHKQARGGVVKRVSPVIQG